MLACITGGSIYRLLRSGQAPARAAVTPKACRELPPRQTPFGPCEPIFLIDGPQPFYVLPRQRDGLEGLSPGRVNYRANIYALKDLGVKAILSWTAAGAITHNLHVGQIVVPDDVLDLTRQRPNTFFPDSPIGLLRQFPVFCPGLRVGLESVLTKMRLSSVFSGTAAVVEGPRLETPAEVRMLSLVGAALVNHTLAPDVFLARELQMCFASACHIVNYAETGSRHRPFTTGELFGGLAEEDKTGQARRTGAAALEIAAGLAEYIAVTPAACECGQSMAHFVQQGLPADWQQWFSFGKTDVGSNHA
jgi:5'-methylthioadenosine phosphorylase